MEELALYTVLINLVTFIAMTIAALISYKKPKKLVISFSISYIIQLICTAIWFNMAVCLKEAIIALGIILPPIVFILTYFFLKKAKFSKEKLKGRQLLFSLLKIIIYGLLMSPIVALSFGFHITSIDCGI